MSINKEFYEKYYDGLTFKVHLMRWLWGIAFLAPVALMWIAIYFGGKIAVGIIVGFIFLVVFPYIVGGMSYDMHKMNKAGVYYR